MGHDAVVVAVTVEVTGGRVTGIRVVVVVVDVAVIIIAGAVTVAVTVEGVGTVFAVIRVKVSSSIALSTYIYIGGNTCTRMSG